MMTTTTSSGSGSLAAARPPTAASAASQTRGATAGNAQSSDTGAQSFIPPAPFRAPRAFLCGLAPTLSDAEILQLAQPHNRVYGATFFPARPIGPNGAMARSVAFAMKNAQSVKRYKKWIKKHAAEDYSIATKFVASVGAGHDVCRYIAAGEPLEACLSHKRADLLLDTSASMAALANLPEAQGYAWQIVVENLAGHASDLDVLAHIVPRKVQPCGATLDPPVENVSGGAVDSRSVTLAFKSQDQAEYCALWIEQEAQLDASFNALALAGTQIKAHPPTHPQDPVPAVSNWHTTPTSLDHTLPPTPAPQPRFSAADLPPARKSSKFRVIIRNLIHSVSADQLVAALLPPGVVPAGMTMVPLQKLVGRPEIVRAVVFELACRNDAVLTLEWAKEQLESVGGCAELRVPKTKVDVWSSRR